MIMKSIVYEGEIDNAKGAKSRIMMPVECGACGWQGRRKTGQIVQCPKCGSFAAARSMYFRQVERA